MAPSSLGDVRKYQTGAQSFISFVGSKTLGTQIDFDWLVPNQYRLIIPSNNICIIVLSLKIPVERISHLLGHRKTFRNKIIINTFQY